LLHYEEWGEGDPVIALHPLALESSAFRGVAGVLESRGLRTLAVDLPGFGRTPAPEGALSISRLAEPVLELARELERPPLLLGMSLGGRVALEVALMDPRAVRGAVLVAPFLPWRRGRRALALMERFDPRWGERLPLEKAWPLLKRVAEAVESVPDLEHDWLARAAVRVIYYSSCPATRVAFLSAMREMSLEPGSGPHSLWARLSRLAPPATFLWAGRDSLIPAGNADEVAERVPRADRVEVACAGHFVSGRHFRCMRHAISLAVQHTLEAERGGTARRLASGGSTLAPCLTDASDLDEEAAAPNPAPHSARRTGATGEP